MATKQPHNLETEATCLVRALIPMSKDDESRVAAKAVAIMLVATWLVITLALSLEGVDAIAPPHYGLFTALVFLLIGKLWDLEVADILPTGGK
jgi:hypothetical protein